MFFSSTEINMRLFADDACLSYHYSDPAWVNSVIKWRVEKGWCMVACYKLIVSKTKFLLFNNTSK